MEISKEHRLMSGAFLHFRDGILNLDELSGKADELILKVEELISIVVELVWVEDEFVSKAEELIQKVEEYQFWWSSKYK